jgi:hypothetical protein
MDRAPPNLLRSMATAVVACTLGACAPGIGDECKTSLDCSSQGSRLCDRTQPHGYCTLRGCEQGTCPEESVCVKFRPQAERLSTTWCMAKCDDDDDCRSDEGYRCRKLELEADGGAGVDAGQPEAEVLGRQGQGFCSVAPEP